MKKIKIAQIGVGHDHAGVTFLQLKQQSDIFELVGYAKVPEDSYNLPRLSFNGCSEWYDGYKCMSVDELLNYPGLDAVCIETEDRALTKYAIAAAKKGLHIHMDKPGGCDESEYNELIDLIKEKNLVFQTGYMYRYNPEVIKLKQDIKDGKLGEIISVEAQMNCTHDADKRQWLESYPGGMLYFLGCHLIDLVYGICGEPEEVIPLSVSSGIEGVTAKDFGMAVFKYKNGVSFVKSTAVEIGGFHRRQLVVCGTKGTVEIKPLEWVANGFDDIVSAQRTGVRCTTSKSWQDAGTYHESIVHGRYEAMLASFAAYVNGTEENPYGYEYEKKLHSLILKACGK